MATVKQDLLVANTIEYKVRHKGGFPLLQLEKEQNICILHKFNKFIQFFY